jgi:hypothetical protein
VLDRVADRIEGVDSCLEIEDVLMDRIPGAEEVVVVPDGHGRPVPVVCMRDGAPLDPEAWKAASAGLEGLSEPFVVTAGQLRRTATVKPRRYLLTEMIRNRADGRDEPAGDDAVLREGA